MAFVVGLTLDQFWSMTFWEFRLAMDAYSERTTQHQQLLAWHAANIMNMWTKRRIKPKDLLRKSDSAPFFLRGGGESEKKRLVEYMRSRNARRDN